MMGKTRVHAVIVLVAVSLVIILPAAAAVDERIAFTSDRDGNSEIYVMNADGTGQTRLTNYGLTDEHPAWSPDGTKIAFSSWHDTGDSPNIYIMNADGTGLTRITNFHHLQGGGEPAWSPDGTKIAFAYLSGEFYQGIYSVNTDGTGLMVLSEKIDDRNPAWSPDGKKIAFSSGRDEDYNHEIYVMNADGTGQTRLTNDPSEDRHPSWSPDGTTIAFTRDDTIYLMSATGTEVTALTDGYKPVWSPDGTMVAFQSQQDNPPSEIYTIRADGTTWSRIASYASEPSWTGRSLTVTAPESEVSWNVATRHNITWFQAGLLGTDVKIELLKRVSPTLWTVDRTISSSVLATSGTYPWILPDIPEGSKYKIKITSNSFPSVLDVSSGNLTITRSPAITVTSPDGGESWFTGKRYDITWVQAGLSGTDVKIELLKQVTPTLWTVDRTISSSVPADPGTCSWTLPGISPGSGYKVKVTSVSSPSVHDATDGLLTIRTFLRPFPGYSQLPGDWDNDGIYEDLNGNGRLDFADVVLYFTQMAWIAENEPTEAFDLNGNDRIDFADIVALFNEV